MADMLHYIGLDDQLNDKAGRRKCLRDCAPTRLQVGRAAEEQPTAEGWALTSYLRSITLRPMLVLKPAHRNKPPIDIKTRKPDFAGDCASYQARHRPPTKRLSSEDQRLPNHCRTQAGFTVPAQPQIPPSFHRRRPGALV